MLIINQYNMCLKSCCGIFTAKTGTLILLWITVVSSNFKYLLNLVRIYLGTYIIICSDHFIGDSRINLLRISYFNALLYIYVFICFDARKMPGSGSGLYVGFALEGGFTYNFFKNYILFSC